MLSPQRVGAALGALLILIGLCGAPRDARADNTQGTSCTAPATAGISGSTDGSSLVQPAGGNSLICVSGTWQYPNYILGTAAAAAGASCSGDPVGTLRYNTTVGSVEVCNGTNWTFLAAGSTSCGTPSGLSFTNVTSASLGTVVTSNTATITFSGCSGGALSVSVSGAATAQISINGGAWATSGAITSGQTLQVRLTASSSVNTLLTATVTVGPSSTNWTVTTGTAGSLLFETPTTANGNLGGLSGADAQCQYYAGSLGYPGTYKAILSDDTTSAASRLTVHYPVVRAASPSTTIAATNLWSGGLANAVTGAGALAWTGSNPDGSSTVGDTCSNWTVGNTSASAAVGQDFQTSSSWITRAIGTCDSGLGSTYLYCLQQ
jgi:hypothetical protein